MFCNYSANCDELSVYLCIRTQGQVCYFNASSAPCCNAFILCKALWIVLYMKCAIQINLTWLDQIRALSISLLSFLTVDLQRTSNPFNSVRNNTDNDGSFKAITATDSERPSLNAADPVCTGLPLCIYLCCRVTGTPQPSLVTPTCSSSHELSEFERKEMSEVCH